MSRNVSVTWRPLTQWPAGRARTSEFEREPARFKSAGRWGAGEPGSRSWQAGKPMPLQRTLDDLDRELWHIGAQDAVIQVDVRGDRDIRQDGQMRADAKTNSPAVVLSFSRRGVRTVFACDSFTRWQDNLRGIVLGLEGLRRLERYGIVQSGEQYRGWQALPASTTPTLSTEQASVLLSRHSGIGAADIRALIDHAVDAARRARKRTHPDTGGAAADFQLVQEAARVVAQHHGVPTL